jgi:hypothetical protein
MAIARTATRANELAVRTALGATRARIVTQIFVECLVLAILASGAGLLFMGTVLQLVWRVIPATWAAALPYWIRWDIGPETAIHDRPARARRNENWRSQLDFSPHGEPPQRDPCVTRQPT